LEKAKAEFIEKEINFGKIDAIAKNLEITLGIDKAGESINWGKIKEAEVNSKVAKRELDLASEKVLKVEEKLKENKEKIRLIRIKEAKTEGLKLNKKVVNAIKTIENCRELYNILNREIRGDLEKNESITQIIGGDFRNRDILNIMNYPTEAFLKRSKEYQKS